MNPVGIESLEIFFFNRMITVQARTLTDQLIFQMYVKFQSRFDRNFLICIFLFRPNKGIEIEQNFAPKISVTHKCE